MILSWNTRYWYLFHLCWYCSMMSYYARPDNQLENSLWTYKYKPKKATEVRYVVSVSSLHWCCVFQLFIYLSRLTPFPLCPVSHWRWCTFTFHNSVILVSCRYVVMMNLSSFWVIGYICGMKEVSKSAKLELMVINVTCKMMIIGVLIQKT